MTSPASSSHGIDRERLAAVVAPIARAHGAEVVDFEWKTEHGGWVLRVTLERLGAAEAALSTEKASVDLELCSKVSRDLSPALDVSGLIDHRYSLEVSTPGVERPLKSLRDYARFEGKKAKLRLASAIDGQRVLAGVLGQVHGESVPLTVGPRTHEIPFNEIASGHLVFEFGPAPKPGKKK